MSVQTVGGNATATPASAPNVNMSLRCNIGHGAAYPGAPHAG
jgi:hypothetical protein